MSQKSVGTHEKVGIFSNICLFCTKTEAKLKNGASWCLQLSTLFQTKTKYLYVQWSFIKNFWKYDELVSDPCLVNISVQAHGIDLKILPQLPLISANNR
jgi:hypothetical protein